MGVIKRLGNESQTQLDLDVRSQVLENRWRTAKSGREGALEHGVPHVHSALSHYGQSDNFRVVTPARLNSRNLLPIQISIGV